MVVFNVYSFKGQMMANQVPELTEEQVTYVLNVWFNRYRYSTFHKKTLTNDIVLPKRVNITEVFKHSSRGWCVSFIDADTYLSASYFKTFESFFEVYDTCEN